MLTSFILSNHASWSAPPVEAPKKWGKKRADISPARKMSIEKRTIILYDEQENKENSVCPFKSGAFGRMKSTTCSTITFSKTRPLAPSMHLALEKRAE